MRGSTRCALAHSERFAFRPLRSAASPFPRSRREALGHLSDREPPAGRRPHEPRRRSPRFAETAEAAGFDAIGFTDHPAPSHKWLQARRARRPRSLRGARVRGRPHRADAADAAHPRAPVPQPVPRGEGRRHPRPALGRSLRALRRRRLPAGRVRRPRGGLRAAQRRSSTRRSRSSGGSGATTTTRSRADVQRPWPVGQPEAGERPDLDRRQQPRSSASGSPATATAGARSRRRPRCPARRRRPGARDHRRPGGDARGPAPHARRRRPRPGRRSTSPSGPAPAAASPAATSTPAPTSSGSTRSPPSASPGTARRCRATRSPTPSNRSSATGPRSSPRAGEPDPEEPRMTRLGYQIPNFTYPGVGPAGLFDAVRPRPRRPSGRASTPSCVMDHFYQLPMLGTARELHARVLHDARPRWPARPRAVPARRPRHRQHLPATHAAGQDRHRARRRVERTGPARHRRRLVRARARLARLRVRHVHRPVREARGGAADHPADAARRASDPRRQALHGAGRHQPAAARRSHPGDDRRQRREEDAADGGPVRRRVEPHLAASTRSPASSTCWPPTASGSAATAPRSR